MTEWHEYFRNMRLERDAKNEEDAVKNEIEILVPGREALPHEVVSPAQKRLNGLTAHGWAYKVGYAKSRKDGDVYKTGARAGQKRADKTTELCWIEAIHPERRERFRATWFTEGGKTTLDSIIHNGMLISNNELNELIRGDNDNTDIA